MDVVTMFGNVGSKPFNVIVNAQSKDTSDKSSVRIFALTDISSEIHFYQKEGGIYMLNTSLNDPLDCFIQSSWGVEAADVVIDDTFTEISIEKV